MKTILYRFFIHVCLCSTILLPAGGCSTTGRPNDVAAPISDGTASTVAADNAAAHEDLKHIESGDFVTVNYSLRMKSGELIMTTLRQVAEDPSVQKVPWYLDSKSYQEEDLIAGRETKRAELAQAVIGMASGESKTVELPPDKAFGPPDSKKISAFPLTKSLPREFNLTAQAYVHQFKSFPTVGKMVNFVPYYQSRITKVEEEVVTLESMAVDGAVIPSDFGDTTVQIENDTVHLTLTPIVGATFTLRGQKGVISEIGEDTFTVDFNHPGAGKPLLMDLEIVSFVKSATFRNKELAWIESHDEGYRRAKESNKPMVLVLYAEWCSWSKRLLNDTITDPRIQAYWDDFVWVKVNSNIEKEYKEFYEQDGFPMIVLAKSDGEIFKKIGGFKDGPTLAKELDICLHSKEKING